MFSCHNFTFFELILALKVFRRNFQRLIRGFYKQ
nr:MAG TPA: hypothetical protein [Caudoviricetes sp.]